MFTLLLIALLLALAYIWVTGHYPGGIIVPGYLVLFIDQPIRLLGTLVAALLAAAIYRLASRWLILYGKRRFVFLIFTGALLATMLTAILPHFHPAALELKVIGLVIPGLIAGQFERQGLLPTTAGMAIVTAASWFAHQLLLQLF